VSLSSTEAEYIAASEACRELLWLKKLLDAFRIKDTGSLRLLKDNQASIALASNESTKQRTKHLDIKYHFIREQVQVGRVTLEYCRSAEMVADMLTKAVGKAILERLRDAARIQRL
jgi:hypothetical protein